MVHDMAILLFLPLSLSHKIFIPKFKCQSDEFNHQNLTLCILCIEEIFSSHSYTSPEHRCYSIYKFTSLLSENITGIPRDYKQRVQSILSLYYPFLSGLKIYRRVVIIGHVNADTQILGLQFCVNNVAFLTAKFKLKVECITTTCTHDRDTSCILKAGCKNSSFVALLGSLHLCTNTGRNIAAPCSSAV